MKAPNPYLSIYEQLAKQISPSRVFRERAMFVSEQAAQIHNALGVIIRDLLKTLSLACQDPIEDVRSAEDSGDEPTRLARPIQERSQPIPSLQSALPIMEVANDDELTCKASFARALKPSKPVSMVLPKAPEKRYSQLILNPQLLRGEQVSNNSEQNLIPAGRAPQYRQRNRASEATYRISCNQCQRFYQAVGRDNEELCECSSRHRSSQPAMTRINDFDSQFQI